MDIALAVGATVVAIAFGMSTFDRWLRSHKPHEMAWTVAFGLFALAAAFMAAGATAGWTEWRFRGFYLFGAIVNVPVLALGTLLLFTADKSRRLTTYGVAFFCVFGAGVMVSTPFLTAVPTDSLAQGSEVFGPWPRVLAAVGSGFGATVIFVGAVTSAIQARRLRNVISNVLIATGTLILGASGLLNSVLGEMTAFSITLTLGICVLFVGFLVATSAPKKIVVDVRDEVVTKNFDLLNSPVESIK